MIDQRLYLEAIELICQNFRHNQMIDVWENLNGELICTFNLKQTKLYGHRFVLGYICKDEACTPKDAKEQLKAVAREGF